MCFSKKLKMKKRRLEPKLVMGMGGKSHLYNLKTQVSQNLDTICNQIPQGLSEKKM